MCGLVKDVSLRDLQIKFPKEDTQPRVCMVVTCRKNVTLTRRDNFCSDQCRTIQTQTTYGDRNQVLREYAQLRDNG